MSLNIEGSAANNACGNVGTSLDYARACGGKHPAPPRARGPSAPRLWPTLAAALLIPLFIAAGNWQWNKAALKGRTAAAARIARAGQPAIVAAGVHA